MLKYDNWNTDPSLVEFRGFVIPLLGFLATWRVEDNPHFRCQVECSGKLGYQGRRCSCRPMAWPLVRSHR
jgi:hypothetical protein